MTPSWTMPDAMKVVFRADEVTLEGGEFRVGIVRGRTYRGDWGLSFVRKTLEAGGVVDADGNRDVIGDDVVLTGATFDNFTPFTTIKDRVQIGLVSSIGAAAISGTARRNDTETVPMDEVLKPAGRNIRVSPLARLELALAVIVTEGFKLRVSGGFNYPGLSRVTVGGVLLFDR